MEIERVADGNFPCRHKKPNMGDALYSLAQCLEVSDVLSAVCRDCVVLYRVALHEHCLLWACQHSVNTYWANLLVRDDSACHDLLCSSTDTHSVH